MSRKIFALSIALILLLALSTPALAITYGVPDDGKHPNVGSIVFYWSETGNLYQWCSGTLIYPNVFLTAAHCTRNLTYFMDTYKESAWWVSFEENLLDDETIYTGQIRTNPAYDGRRGQYGASDTGDIAVILLDGDLSGITPAKLPTLGLLDGLKAEHKLKDTLFTAVGYGDQRETNRTAFQAIIYSSFMRNRADQEFLSLTDAWLSLSMNFATGNGGTCYGDSGGPHFIHLEGVEKNIVASITVTGDTQCKALDKTYRMDTEAARNFLDEFVPLP